MIPAVLAKSKRLTRMEAAIWKLASRKLALIVAFALIPIGVRVALLPWMPPPEPGIQDEFSYLLAGDTFASGRLTNAPHPFWVFFESVHIIQQPTYMSKYPPLTGLILAIGQRVFGQPWIAILLSVGVLCGILAWAMQNWLPPFWALIGTALAVLRIGILSYWSESYWGGAGAAIGGALLIGSLPGLIRRPSFVGGMPAAIGIALLANSRPFEGLLLTLLGLGYAVWQIVRRTTAPAVCFRRLSRSIAAPVIVVMVPVGAWMAYYNFRVTGGALVMPYVAHARQYEPGSPFLWTEAKAPIVYRHEGLRRVWVDWELRKKIIMQKHFFLTRLLFLGWLANFYLGIPLAIVTVACAGGMLKKSKARCLPRMAQNYDSVIRVAYGAVTLSPVRGPRDSVPVGISQHKARATTMQVPARAALWLTILFLAGLNVELGIFPHYAAPATVLFYISAAGALRWLRHWRPRRASTIPAVYKATLAIIVVQLTLSAFWPEHRFLYDRRGFLAERARILERLNSVPGKHLVFVRYGANHNINSEWVYNRADIDGSAVVWARSMGREKDLTLICYFKDRDVWLLDENGTAQFSRYSVKTPAT